MIIAASSPRSRTCSWVLTHLHDSVGLTWAWSIVGLVVIVRMLLVPLTVEQIHSMQNLQAHAPEMKAIQQKYKHDKPRMNQEMMAFYKENQINPAASCLPMLAPVPDLHRPLLRPPRLQGRDPADVPRLLPLEWLGLIDITEDTKVGWEPLLIVLYAISQLTSSYLMSQNMQPAQRVMLLVLPIAFIPFVLNFPSGLMLYWLTTNLWTTGQGLITRRLTPKRNHRRRRARGRPRRQRWRPLPR